MAALSGRGAGELGLLAAMPRRLLPLLAGCMVFLACLALAGSLAAGRVAGRWQGASRVAILQVPDPEVKLGGSTRAGIAAGLLGADARRLPASEVATLLRPWLGADALALALPLPAVFTLAAPLPPERAASLASSVPGAVVTRDSAWQASVAGLAVALRRGATTTLLVAAGAAAGAVALAAHAGLAASRSSAEIVHGLGATDARLAGECAACLAGLTLRGALLGLLPGTLAVVALARATGAAAAADGAAPASLSWAATLAGVPAALWIGLAILPAAAALIGWCTAQVSVRAWLARLP